MKRLSWNSIDKVQTFCRNDPPAQLLNWKLAQPPSFEQPALNDIVKLTSIRLNKSNLVGNILVKNISFRKTLLVRYTTDYWKTYQQEDAAFVVKSFNGFDSFSFSLNLDNLYLDFSRPDFTLSFCIKYAVNESEYWDNNNGQNYNIELLPPVPKSVASISIPIKSSVPKAVPNASGSSGRRFVSLNHNSNYWSNSNSYTSRMKFYDHSRGASQQNYASKIAESFKPQLAQGDSKLTKALLASLETTLEALPELRSVETPPEDLFADLSFEYPSTNDATRLAQSPKLEQLFWRAGSSPLAGSPLYYLDKMSPSSSPISVE